MAVSIQNYRARISNTLRAFIDVRVGPFTLHDVTVHEADSGSRWIGMPSRPQIAKDGTILRAPKTGKPAYAASITIDDPAARERFRKAVLDALDELQGKEGAE